MGIPKFEVDRNCPPAQLQPDGIHWDYPQKQKDRHNSRNGFLFYSRDFASIPRPPSLGGQKQHDGATPRKEQPERKPAKFDEQENQLASKLEDVVNNNGDQPAAVWK